MYLLFRLAAFESEGGLVLQVPDRIGEGRWQCCMCEKRFDSKAALAVHRYTAHSTRSDLACIGGTSCEVCLIEFHNTFKLREHVRKSVRCRSAYYHADLPLAESTEIVGRRLVDRNPYGRSLSRSNPSLTNLKAHLE